jgi:flagellar protein FliJ
MRSRAGSVPNRTSYRQAAASLGVQVADMKRRIALMKHMITDFERMAADLDREISTGVESANMHHLDYFTYQTCAEAIASRRDNLRCSADVLRAELAKVTEELRAIVQ